MKYDNFYCWPIQLLYWTNYTASNGFVETLSKERIRIKYI